MHQVEGRINRPKKGAACDRIGRELLGCARASVADTPMENLANGNGPRTGVTIAVKYSRTDIKS